MNPSSRLKQQASITDLPSELLLIIFKIVHSFVPSAERSRHYYGWRSKRRFITLDFPYNLSSVSRTWQEVMSLEPEFWTRLIVYVDVQWQPASLQEQLEWSKNLPFELILTKKNPDDHLEHPLEQRHTYSSVATLMPHMHRCTSFSILSVQSSSTLPSIATDFTHPANNLRMLRLECQTDDSKKSFANSITDAPDLLSCSQLTQLFIDGENLLSLCLHTPKWLYGVTHLSVAHYNKASRGTEFSMTEFLSTISEMVELTHLAIEDVDFGYFGRAVKTRLPDLQVLELVSQSNIDMLFDRIDTYDILNHSTLEELNIRNCHLKCPSNSSPLHTAQVLRLENVDCLGASKREIAKYMGLWGGSVVQIDRCPIVNDIVWMIGQRGLGNFNWYNLFDFNILNCPGLSISTLRQTITKRNKEYVRSGSRYDAITQLRLSGDVPALSPEDVEFFAKHVECFEWADSKRN
ncbi:hypothetical protein HGRIS_003420 [Hohenbuehelia grisea]|uniref:F-box domain-containing protein n=1 Tax=Hohenbuehelia grisea TaxID=104357 RepID=A0ABR3JGE6_9AGAR